MENEKELLPLERIFLFTLYSFNYYRAFIIFQKVYQGLGIKWLENVESSKETHSSSENAGRVRIRYILCVKRLDPFA